MQGAMNDMQQRVYWPPNVAGWEGGMSWLNTNTVQGRFDLITRVQWLKYSNVLPRRTAEPAAPTSRPRPPRRPFDRAYDVASTARGSRRRRSRSIWPTPTRGAGDLTAALRRQRIYTCKR